MTHLNMTVWPNDYKDGPMWSLVPTQLRWNNETHEIAIVISSVVISKDNSSSPTFQKQFAEWPEIEDIPNPYFRFSKMYILKEIESQFSLHTLPSIKTDNYADVIDFIQNYGCIEVEDFSTPLRLEQRMTSHPKIKTKIEKRPLRHGRSEIGYIYVLQESTALQILKDLKAMSKHIIAYSRNGDEIQPWNEAGYFFKNSKHSIDDVRELLFERLNMGYGLLRPSLRMGDEDRSTNTAIYSISCLQLFSVYETNRRVLKCNHLHCDNDFLFAEGYEAKRSNRTTGLKYCSRTCARNASQMAVRKRKKEKQEVKK